MADVNEIITEPVGEIGYIDNSNFQLFRSFLLPEVIAAFENDEPVAALGWVVSDVAAGAIAGYAQGDTFIISSFYVAPAYRKRGGGGQLFDALSDIVFGEISQLRIGFSVLLPEHEELERFLKERGFTDLTDDENSMFRTSLSAMLGNTMLKSVPESPKVISLSEADDYLLRKEQKRAMVDCDPIPLGGFSASSVRKDLSAVYIEKNEVTGYVIVEDSDNGTLSVSSALNRGSMKSFPLMLKKVLENLKANCSEDTILTIPVISSVSAGIVRKLDPNAKQVYRLMEKIL